MTSTIDFVTQTYPAFAGLMGIPDIADLMTRAQQGNWTSTQLQAELYATNWWKQNSQTQRTWQIQKLTDPASAALQTLNTSNQIVSLAQQMGIGITHPQVQWIAEEANQQGWDATTMRQHVASLASQGDPLSAGSITASQTALRGVAASYGVPIADATTLDWARRIAAGNTDQNSFTEYAKNQALASHPYWAKQLQEGMTVQQLADPYIQTASKLLEVSPSAVDLSNPKWSHAFVQTNKDGTKSPMGLDAWQQKLMTDPQYGWDRTDNAKQSAFQISDQIRQSFGAM